MRLALALLSACTLGTSSPDTCEPMPGLYWLHWERVSGDCVELNAGTYDPAEGLCPGAHIEWDKVTCTERYDAWCGGVHLVGETTYARGGMSGRGVATSGVWRDGGLVCKGAYVTRVEKM